MRYQFSEPDYWSRVSPVKGVLLGLTLILVDSFLLGLAYLEIKAGTASVFGLVISLVILINYYLQVHAMVVGYLARRGL